MNLIIDLRQTPVATTLVYLFYKKAHHFMAQYTLTASIHKEDNLYVATCVEIGTVSQGETVETALANLLCAMLRCFI